MGRGTRPAVHKNGRVCPICYTLRAGRAYGPQGQRLQGFTKLGAFSFRPYCRATATEPQPQGQNLGQNLGRSSQIRGPYFLPYFWMSSRRWARSPGQRSPVTVTGPKQDGPKLGVLIFGPSFGDRLGKVSFLGRAVCGGTLSPSDLSACQALSLPKLRAKRKGPI